MHRLGFAFLAATIALAGCLATPPSADPDAAHDASLWMQGLGHEYATPAFVTHHSDTERRAGTEPPGAPRYAALDRDTQAFMAAYEIPSGAVAILHDGRLLYENAYGVTDTAGTPADTKTLFRLASVTKPMTAALIDLQVRQGLYNQTDPVFCLPPGPSPGCRLHITPHPDHPVIDERLRDVQVAHLLDHTGGWGRSMDWTYRAPGVHTMATALDVPAPPHPWRVAQFLLGENLTHDPGTTTWYCNVCYMLLGLIAEAATGVELQELYDAYLFRPLDIEDDIELGRTLPADRNPRETAYRCDGNGQSVYDDSKTVCQPDGGYAMEIVRSGGGLIATPAAVAAVYHAYPDHLYPEDFNVQGTGVYGQVYEWNVHGGALNGVATRSGIIQDRASAAGTVQYVVLFSSSQPLDCYDGELPAFGDFNLGCPMDVFEQMVMNHAVAVAASEP